MLLSLVAIGVFPVLAVNVSDTVGWKTTKNYASLPVQVLDCTPYGGNAMHDGICDNWKVNSGPNPGLHIAFTDNAGTSPTTYYYNMTCNVHATYTPDTSDPQNVVDKTGLTVCPSPSNADVYVELDWMTNQGPVDPSVITDVVMAYHKHGINLHVQAGESPVIQNGSQQITASSGDIAAHYCDVRTNMAKNYPTTNNGLTCSATTTNYQGYGLLKQNFFGTVSERQAPPTTTIDPTLVCPSPSLPSTSGAVATSANSYNCLTAKRQVFHYGMFVNYQWANTQSSGWSEIIGNDFLVSLGNFENGVGTIDEQEGAFMHELGHNFGLHHGGMVSPTGNDDDTNCKPNYLSVMSYTYEFRKTADLCRPLDYSSAILPSSSNPSMNEASLTDTQMSSYVYPTDNPDVPINTIPGQTPAQTSCSATQGQQRQIWWSTPNNGFQNDLTDKQIDWNLDGISSSTYVQPQKLNNLGFTGCSSTTPTTLDGFDDWNFIKNGNNNGVDAMNFRSSTNFYQGVVAGVESEIASDPDKLSNESPAPPHIEKTPIVPSPNNIPEHVAFGAAAIAAFLLAILLIRCRRMHH